MNKLALLPALALAACASGGGHRADGGPKLRPAADPSAVIAAELAFSQLARSKGQWTAFRETAAPEAEMFVPQRAAAAEWLKGRADPGVTVAWQPHAVWSSCDGSYAVTQGVWERPGSPGSFVTVWQRQPDGRHKRLLDMSISTETAIKAPEMVAARVADCGKSPSQRAMLASADAAFSAGMAAGDSADAAFGGAEDLTLRWDARVAGDGRRHISVELWNGSRFETVIDTGGTVQPR